MQKPEKVPTLSQEKRSKQAKPLEYLVQRAAVDPATCWRRVYQLGSKAELLVVVKQPEGLEGPTYISMITDTAADVVLHWGYCKPGELVMGKGVGSLNGAGSVRMGTEAAHFLRRSIMCFAKCLLWGQQR